MGTGVHKERIAKWLARAGVASRREAEHLIKEGRVSLNGRLVSHPATFVSDEDSILVDQTRVPPAERPRLWCYHKPKGLITTHKDPEGRPTVFDTLPHSLPRIMSVGRLDLNSEGLLLLTNDGALARRLERPSQGETKGFIRRYRVRVFGALNESYLFSLHKGCVVEDMHYGPIEVKIDSRKGHNSWLTLSLREGKNREIRKVLAALNLQVNRLIRMSYGPFHLGNLPRGALKEVPARVLREQLPFINDTRTKSR
ncbi:MAG: rRNA pseudouridine synthase [Acetobacter sp.]|nr:rRNA pseudouridine synthase [Acetobacter sp.]